MKQLSLFLVILMFSFTSFANETGITYLTKIESKKNESTKNESTKIELKKIESKKSTQLKKKRSEHIVMRYLDGCGNTAIIAIDVFCCMSDEDILNYIEDIAWNYINPDTGCFEN